MDGRKLNGNKLLSLVGLVVISLLLVLGDPVPLKAAVSSGGEIASAIAPTLTQNPDIADETPLDYVAALAELQDSLTFQGQPLNPRAVAALIPWLSDQLPGAIAIDVEGTTVDTNQFNAEIFQDNEGRVTAEWTNSEERRFVVYRPVGQLANGTHVLRVWINTGGSGVFPFLMLVDFDLDTEINDGHLRQRLVMKRRGEFVLGDGYNGSISLSGNTVTLSPAPNGESAVTVTIE